ncbi:AraC-like ligand-binding domain-containing protein [Paraburkholderia heleia]|uniref:AraC-like ligand-binding domain-containing protein n=1 Tax=Paraburkholderia heleia TaxID=634127 RepID=UPI0005A67594|nr:helix-turn-helix domain-containing protein [Paraburkholderia heleia]
MSQQGGALTTAPHFVTRGDTVEWDTSCVEISANGSTSQRIDFWREMILRLFADVQIAAIQKQDFVGHVRSQKCDRLRLSDIQSSDQTVNRRYNHARAEYEDKYFAILMLEGTQSVEQDGKVVTLKPGDFALYDATRPHFLTFHQPWREIVVSVPRATLDQFVAGVEQRTATPIDTSQGVGNILRTYLEGMSSQIGAVNDQEMQQLSDTAITLLSMALGKLKSNDLAQSRVKALTLTRVKAQIRTQLGNPELDAQTVADAVGLSPRYINKLFEAEDSSLMRYVWHTRLEYCAKELAAPVSSNARISDIAMKWGFNDMSHFSRAFRECFDMSPRDWRKNSVQNQTGIDPTMTVSLNDAGI